MPSIDTFVQAAATLAVPVLEWLLNRRSPKGGASAPRRRDLAIRTGFIAVALLAVWSPRLYGWLSSGSATEVPEWSDTLDPIEGKVFRNQRVDIDGKAFFRCRFVNTTLVYKGTGPSSFQMSAFEGDLNIQTDNKAAKGLLVLYDRFKTVPGLEVHLNLLNPDGTDRPITEVPK